ncbi:unnamed protein product [Orchesella dallaii]|uniref:Uncharacterized protein n=1 Tax=Orchesella dallaii TaxID=48710 RepID=A0ABP1S627_9HEXA
MIPDENQNGDAGSVGNEWRNIIPIYQNFSAPSSTYINLFRQPGQYNVGIWYGENGNRVNSSLVPNRQSQSIMTFGAHVQTGDSGGEASMPPQRITTRNQPAQPAVPSAHMAGNRDPSMIIPTPDYSSPEQGQRQVPVFPLHVAANGFGGRLGIGNLQTPPTSPKTI